MSDLRTGGDAIDVLVLSALLALPLYAPIIMLSICWIRLGLPAVTHELLADAVGEKLTGTGVVDCSRLIFAVGPLLSSADFVLASSPLIAPVETL